jgi:hypothetical protein
MKGLMSLRRSVLKWFAEKATGNKWFEHGALLVRQLPTDDWIVQPALIGGILEEERCRRFKTLAGAVAYAEREYHGWLMKVLPEKGATEEAHRVSLFKRISTTWTVSWKGPSGLEEAKGLLVPGEQEDALNYAQTLCPDTPLGPAAPVSPLSPIAPNLKSP